MTFRQIIDMKKLLIASLSLLISISFFGQIKITKKLDAHNQLDLNATDTLFRIHEGQFYELGVPSGYINQNGDTIIELNKYFFCFTDTITDFGIVMKKGGKAFAIDQNENKLYEVYWYDNGPDWIVDGRFRIIKDNKIGFADRKGKIIIEPKYQCAFQFKNGIAKVSYKCEYSDPDDEGHRIMTSEEWFYIDINGNKINNKP